MALDNIPKQEGGKLKAVASGTLPSGQPVIVNADGTVSVIGSTDDSVGTPVIYAANNIRLIACTFDSTSNKVVVAYRDLDNSNYGTAVVGTVSGSNISFGTAAVFHSTFCASISIAYDVNAQKVVINYRDITNNQYGNSVVGTVSGTSISFGTPVVFNSGGSSNIASVYDVTAQKIVVAWSDISNSNYGAAIVGTVSGTSISFGSETVFESATTDRISVTYDASAQKVVIAYRDNFNSNYGTAVVGTVSGTSISFGSVAIFESGNANSTSIVYDSNAQKVVIAYQDGDNSDYGTAVVGTVSGTSISFGSPVVFESAASNFIVATYDATAKKVVIAYQDGGNSNYGTAVVGTVSGTSISFGSETVFESDNTGVIASTFDPSSNKVVMVYQDVGNSNYGTAAVFTTGSTNLTSENYIGMSGGVVDVTNNTQQVGTPVAYTTTNGYGASVYDPNSNKVVFAYNDSANSHHGTVVVGTVSGNSITFGSPVVFNAGSTNQISATFDSNLNKVVLAYRDSGNSSYGTAIVGTVSGTSISFGSSVVFETANTVYIGASFDTTSNKVVLAYRDVGNSSYGTAIVGTVNGTSISFGTPVVYESATANDNKCVYDSNVNRTVISYRDSANSDYGTAVVGTVNGTAIAFGSPVIFKSASVGYPQMIFDSTANKVVLAYKADGHGKSIVGTTSVGPNSISFGSEATFIASNVEAIGLTFDSNANKHVVSYRNSGVDTEGYLNVGTVSGNIITFGGQVQFENVAVADTYAVFDGTSKKVIITYLDSGGSNVSTAVVFQNASTDITRGQVASGGAATVDIVGTVSTNQIGLTAGQQYFVQTDGTIGETPADPSVLAGTAISATKMLVKT
jgi:hypothetical protein